MQQDMSEKYRLIETLVDEMTKDKKAVAQISARVEKEIFAINEKLFEIQVPAQIKLPRSGESRNLNENRSTQHTVLNETRRIDLTYMDSNKQDSFY